VVFGRAVRPGESDDVELLREVLLDKVDELVERRDHRPSFHRQLWPQAPRPRPTVPARSDHVAAAVVSAPVSILDAMLLHRSRTRGLLDEVLHDERVTMRMIEAVGRGIAAEARCHLAVPVDDKRPNNEPADVVIARALAFADRIEQLCAIEDDLAAAWGERHDGRLDDEPFETVLNQLVARLDAWRPV
jgi:hypothetical protein